MTPRSPRMPTAASFCAMARSWKTRCREKPEMSDGPKASLTWNSAAKIAWRELQASRGKFLFVILSVAIGVAALTGVRGFSESFQRELIDQARSIMAADLSARMFRLTTQQEDAKLDALAASKGI